MSDSTTQGVHIAVQAGYVPERSRPDQGQFFFAYQVTITNRGDLAVKLLSRKWVIIDAQGRTREVQGEGVVGEQPLLSRGQSFTYTSACPLSTPSGTMTGTYQMLREDGQIFDALIAPFQLLARHLIH